MSANQSAIPADADEIEQAIRHRQDHLAATVDELTTRLQPKNLLSQAASDAQTKAQRLLGTAQEGASAAGAAVTGVMTNPDGSMRTERVAGAAAAVAAAVLVVGFLTARHRGE